MGFVDTFAARFAGTAATNRTRLRIAWRRFQAGLRAADPVRPVQEPPLRAELLSAAQMERHGKLLAQTHELRRVAAPDRLLKRLAENEAALVKNLQPAHCRDRREPTDRSQRRMAPRQFLFD